MHKKSGFTLAEIVITTAIVAIVSLIGLMSFKPNTQMRAAYYRHVYETLKTAAYNGYLEKHDNFGKLRNGDNWVIAWGGMCRDLTDFINTVEGACNRSIIGSDTDFNTAEQSFVATNGVDFWVNRDSSSTNVKDSYGNTTTLTYRIIYANISPKSRTKTIGDNIVPFYITGDGDVIPAGAPLSDPEILKAGVKLTYKVKKDGFISSGNVIIPADSFDEARKMAWGNTIWINNPLSYRMDTDANWGYRDTRNSRQITDCVNYNEPENGTGTCEEVPKEIDKDGNVIDTQTVCCQNCTYNCSPVILNKKVRL